MLARYYEAPLGRFLSVDPGSDTDPEDPQSWNKYAYVRNNPLSHNDPDGREQAVVVGDKTYMGGVDGESAGNDSAKNQVFAAVAGVTAAAATGAALPEIVAAATSLVLQNGPQIVQAGHEVVAGLTDNPSGATGKAAAAASESAPGSAKTAGQMAEDLSKKIGKSNVEANTSKGTWRASLTGKPHGGAESPHIHFKELHVGPNGKTNVRELATKAATKTDIRTARKIVERR